MSYVLYGHRRSGSLAVEMALAEIGASYKVRDVDLKAEDQRDEGYASVNPLFWKPARSALTNEFAGQRCYGYLSFEAFVDAAAACNAGSEPKDFDGVLPTLAATVGATAILEAGRRSLDAGGRPFELIYADEASSTPCGIRAVEH